jgi:hypothetical protein
MHITGRFSGLDGRLLCHSPSRGSLGSRRSQGDDLSIHGARSWGKVLGFSIVFF